MLRTLMKDNAMAFHKAYTSTACRLSLAIFQVVERFAIDLPYDFSWWSKNTKESLGVLELKSVEKTKSQRVRKEFLSCQYSMWCNWLSPWETE